MYARFDFLWKLILFLMPAIFGLVGCGLDSGGTGVVPSVTAVRVEELAVADPEAARDVALAYIRTYHSGSGPTKEAFWFEEMVVPESQADYATIGYRYEDWVVTVGFPTVEPAETIFTVQVERPSPQFDWQGQVDAYGRVGEISFIQTDLIPTKAPPTATPLPFATVTSIPTATGLLVWTPTAEPSQTATVVPTATAAAAPCNAAKFIADVSIQDGTAFSPNTHFTKIWRLQNVGSCTWSTNYDLVFVEGSRMDGDSSRALARPVEPGETVDIAIRLQAPKDPGDYQGRWMLRDANGASFGLGRSADQSFWVSITVVDFGETDFAFDFAQDYCSASWLSENGAISCPGFVDSTNGFVQLLSDAELENRPENEPTLWLHPNEARYGWIEGSYPIYEVEKGDHFKAWVGCLKAYPSCNLTFYLDYEGRNDRVYRLGEWVESYDGEITEIDIDLSNLEGERIQLILGVEANTKNVEDAQGFWFVPRIE